MTKIPIFYTCKVSITAIYSNCYRLLCASKYLLLFIYLKIIATAFYPHVFNISFIDMSLFFIKVVLIITTIVKIHRIFLIKDKPNKKLTPDIYFRYCFGYFLILICVFPLYMLENAIGNMQDYYFYNYAISLTNLIKTIIYVSIFYLSSRLSLILPNIAIEESKISLKKCFNITKANGWRLSVMLFIFPEIVYFIITEFPFSKIGLPYEILMNSLILVVALFEIALLSFSYKHLKPQPC